MPSSPQPPSGGSDARARQNPERSASDDSRFESFGPGRDEAVEAMARKLAREAASWEQRRSRSGGEGQA